MHRYQLGSQIADVARRQLTAASDRPAGASPRRITTVRATALRNLQIRADVEGHSFIADEAESKGGDNTGPAPLRYFLAGLMMCHQVWCIKRAALDGVDLRTLEGEMSAYIRDGRGGDVSERRLDHIGYRVQIEGDSSAVTLAALADAATRLCPAFGTVSRGARIDMAVVSEGATALTRSYGPDLP